MEFEYDSHGELKKINVKKVSSFSPGLMFRKKSPNLLFDLGSEKHVLMHSLFCKPFRIILLDKNKKQRRSFDVFRPKLRIPCYGRYLIEVPLSNLDSDEK